jgi:tRNA (guanine-N(7)-)-methyltransferase subunit TRM82
VSMLTDIAYATVDGRSYIITADRDEHIRVSRGPPQAHIIEGFCFGHEAFVSRLCLTGHNLLVSGGGDPYLLVWNWSEYRVVEKLQIRDAVLEHLKSESHLASTLPEQEENFKIAVSGIWSVPHDQSDVRQGLALICYTRLTICRKTRSWWPVKEFRHSSASVWEGPIRVVRL